MEKKLFNTNDLTVIEELNQLEKVIKFPNSLNSFQDNNLLLRTLKNNFLGDRESGHQDPTVSIFKFTISKLNGIKSEFNNKWADLYKAMNDGNDFCAVDELKYDRFILLSYRNDIMDDDQLILSKNTLFKFDINQVDIPVKICQESHINSPLISNAIIVYKDENEGTKHANILINSLPNKENDKKVPSCLTVYYASNIFCLSGRQREILMTIPLNGDINFSSKINIYLSTDNGWDEITNYFTCISSDNILIRIKLDFEFPDLVIPNSELHDFEHKYPTIKFVLTSFDISSFSNFNFESVFFNVKVFQTKNITISNDNGEVDSQNLFWPFGFIPDIGSQLDIGTSEILNKQCQDVNLNIFWKDVPEDFKKKYENYGCQINNECFKVLINLNFLKNKEKRVFSIFSLSEKLNYTEDSISVNISNSLVNDDFCTTISLSALDLKNNASGVRILSSTDWSESISLKLIEPQNFAFGHVVYNQLIVDEMIENNKRRNRSFFLKKKNDDATTISIYDKPFTPQIEQISLDYSALETKCSLSRLEMKIGDTIACNYSTNSCNLQFDECLIIQVKNFPNYMSFYLDICQREEFQFLVNNGIKVYVGNLFAWCEINDEAVKDQTSGLNISGIIGLNLLGIDQFDETYQFIKIVAKESNRCDYQKVINIIENPIYAYVEEYNATNQIAINDELYFSGANLISSWGGKLAVNNDPVIINHFHNYENKCISRDDIIKFLCNKYQFIEGVKILKQKGALDFHITFDKSKSFINYFIISDIHKDIQENVYDKSILFQLSISFSF